MQFKYFAGLRVNHDPNEVKSFSTFTDINISKEEAMRISVFLINILWQDYLESKENEPRPTNKTS